MGWRLDPEKVPSSAAFVVHPLPGLWDHDRVYKAGAFGLTDAELAELVEANDLPLVQVSEAGLEEIPPNPANVPSSGPAGSPDVDPGDAAQAALDAERRIAEQREEQRKQLAKLNKDALIELANNAGVQFDPATNKDDLVALLNDAGVAPPGE